MADWLFWSLIGSIVTIVWGAIGLAVVAPFLDRLHERNRD